MTLRGVRQRSKPFAQPYDVFSHLPGTAHDDVLLPDVLTFAPINYTWRRFITGLLMDWYESTTFDGSQAELDQFEIEFYDMLEDIQS